jgi:GrpB-like predicted nucleotidyltransferase (UPF0157 family)
MIEIVTYKESWPGEFRALAATLRQALGSSALRIDHIGSTSVPGLAAKDIIDVQITVTALDPAIVTAMLAAGFTFPDGFRRDHTLPRFVGPENEWEKFMFRPQEGRRKANIHVRVQGRANQRFALLFRDYLRAHPASAAAYAELKRRLAAHLAEMPTYSEVKDPAVDLIYFAAEDWAAITHWEVGVADA